MPDYRRNRVAGGTFFFTANLLDRRSDLLVTQIDALREAVRQVPTRAPFHIDASIVLSDPQTRLTPWARMASGFLSMSLAVLLTR